jgi:serine/threonine protein kinase
MNKQLTVSTGQYSSPGKKPVNQDFHGVFIPKEPLLGSKGIAVAIADGISSSNVSQIASETAVTSFLQDYYCTSDSWSVKTSAQRVLKATNSWLYAQTQNSPHRHDKDKGYVCTFSAIIFKSNTAHLFHSGDSRIYRLSDGQLEQLTTDHRREVSPEVSYLTRGLGIHDYLEIDYKAIPIQEEEIFVLATDGVYEYLSEKMLIEAINSTENKLDQVAQSLVEKAYHAGSDDNLTLQIIKINSLSERNLSELQEQINGLPPAPVLQARKEFDGYDVLREIYISSRSHVYLAQDCQTGEKVVIKTPSAEMRNNEEYLENFLMEEWIAKRLNNAHVLKAVVPKRKRNYLYTVTEYIEGKTLAQWMIDNPAPTIDTVRSIIEQIAKGLQAFHRQEMVHQDLRPNNVMIDATGTVKIIDFGATKVAGITEIRKLNAGIVGTAQYTAPEYFRGETGTTQSDLFSLGIIAYQMLSGRLPYGTDIAKTNTAKAQQRLVYTPLLKNKKLNNENNTLAWVDYAIKKAVEINPAKRYIEVAEFIHELKHPNPRYLSKARPPLIERNPVVFWQGISFILMCIVVYQTIR